MKTRYNLSKIMKLAHHMMKYEGFNRSDALKLAWDKAKRSEFYLIIEVRKPSINFNYDMSGAANYYASKQSGAYTGD